MSAPTHKLILASAGTGKTYQLTNQFLRLLFAGVEPERILATTFTRKAAGEILDRVLLRLVEAVESAKPREALADAIEAPGLSAADCRGLLSKLVRSLDTFQVRTIDSFFVHLVRLFALDLELPPNWRIASTRDGEALQSEAMQDVLSTAPAEEAVRLLRELDSGGVGRGVHGRMLEHASQMRPVFLESAQGAWDGIDPGARPSDAAVESTLEAVAAAEVPVTGKGAPDSRWAKAVTKLIELTAEKNWTALLGSGLVKVFLTEGRAYYNKPMPASLADAIAPIARCAAFEFLTTLRARNQATHALLERFEAAYGERKRQTGAYGFDDLPLALAPRGGAESPIEARELDLWFRLDSQVDHLLLDEFQDTSPIQWRILEKMASEIAADGTGERSFFCVGDVKQSIYGFRQAEPRLLQELDTLLPGLVPEAIDKSYRSSRIVLETVNHVFGGLADNPALAHDDVDSYAPGARRWQDRFHPHVAAKNLPGATFVIEAREPAEGESADLPRIERAVDRAAAIAAEAPHATVGILLRERKHIANLIHRLRRRGVDASGEGGNELTDSEAVLGLLSLLHLADHPGDSAAAFHIATSPFGGYVGLPKGASDEKRREVARGIRRRLVTEGLGPVCADFAERVSADPSTSAWDEARFSQLVELAFAFPFEGDAGLRASDFVDHVRSERVEVPGGARVRVMTVHASKGLEFDAVLLPELHKKFVGQRSGLLIDRPRPDGLIETVSISPSKNLLIADPALREIYDETTARMFEDGLCNLYVGMTRAARRLELIVPWEDPKHVVKVPTVADFVRAALPADELRAPDAEGVIWSHPENAAADGWAAGLVEEPDRDGAQELVVTSLELAQSTRARRLPRRSPSAEEGGRRVRAESLFASRAGARRGSLVHHWLESLEWVEDFALDDESALASGSEIEPDLDARRLALGQLRESLQAEPVKLALSRTSCGAPEDVALDVRNEHAFSIILSDESGEEQHWTGFIDRLVLAHRDESVIWADVLDYKTDILTEDELPERVAYYRPQLEHYGRVVAAQTGLATDAIRMRLAFLHLGRIIDIEVA
ncbi:MAG: UvrD-helicase domain-containing protein [Deltaproteobacteria bacterium]|nr:UvrD-helicase domain-containing protein [Deltaproteobacteria bacterium]MBW2444474.1 UvrD-helicase domain-containing protein [Deltaproteobacteria bacterium]